jgi:hypothetical protein
MRFILAILKTTKKTLLFPQDVKIYPDFLNENKFHIDLGHIRAMRDNVIEFNSGMVQIYGVDLLLSVTTPTLSFSWDILAPSSFYVAQNKSDENYFYTNNHINNQLEFVQNNENEIKFIPYDPQNLPKKRKYKSSKKKPLSNGFYDFELLNSDDINNNPVISPLIEKNENNNLETSHLGENDESNNLKDYRMSFDFILN